MKKLIGVITEDKILYNKIRLLLRHAAEVRHMSRTDSPEPYALVFADARLGLPDFKCVTIGDGCDIPLYFRHEDVFEALDGSGEDSEDTLVLAGDKRHAYIHGEEVKLTEVEYKLLLAILSADGFVSKQELLQTVWGEGHDEGVVNVYVHYLRRKLEKSGYKVIISSRNEGYRIDEKYRRKS